MENEEELKTKFAYKLEKADRNKTAEWFKANLSKPLQSKSSSASKQENEFFGSKFK